jgi:nucleoside-diphosphate-sugar epimerase
MKKIAITGAAGNLGGITAKYLVEKTEFDLNLLVHKKPLPDNLSNNSKVSSFKCDLAKKETLHEALKGVDTIVHYAGVLFKANPEKFLPTTNIKYFKNLIDVAKEENVRKIILISFPHVEGYTSQENPSTDKHDRTPVSMHAKTRLAEEKILLKNYPDGVILRVGMVYGRGILMPDAARWFSKRYLLGVWKEPTEIHLISRIDYVEIIKRTIENDNLVGVYNIGDDGAQTLQEYLDFAAIQWKSKKPWRMPLWMIYAAASVLELVSLIFRVKSPLTVDFIDIGRVSYYGDTTRMKKEIIDNLQHPTMVEGANIF